jgi:small redox-active disulfide protein 2
MKIEILGTGCPKCKTTEKNVRKAVEELGIQAEIVKVDDLQEIINRGVMMTPAVFIDGKAKVVGRVPSPDDIKKLLQKEGEKLYIETDHVAF